MVRENDDQSDEARIEAYLQGLDVAALRKLVLEASWRDDALREKLLMAATVAESTGLSALRQVVKQATRTNGFVEYREAGGYANRLEDLAELLSQRIEDGQHVAAHGHGVDDFILPGTEGVEAEDLPQQGCGGHARTRRTSRRYWRARVAG